jgi:tRNA(Ile)-lysidine synthase
MIKLQGKLPRRVWLACSGGVDSMAALDFLRRNHDIHVLHFNHGTAHGEKAQAFMERYCTEKQIPLTIGEVSGTIPPGPISREAWWREQRYAFLDKFFTVPVITCHHLDDCVETWVMSSMHGTAKWIPYRRRHVIRPFRLTRKRDLTLWCELNNVPWIEDGTNEDIHYTRNYVRHEMMPHVLQVNPGIHKTIAKKVKEDVEGIERTE